MAGTPCILLHGRNSPNSLQEELTSALKCPSNLYCGEGEIKVPSPENIKSEIITYM
jgi:hypothetical protein